MESEVYQKLDEESHRWLQCNKELKKVASIIAVQELMVERRALKTNGGLRVESDNVEYVGKQRKQ